MYGTSLLARVLDSKVDVFAIREKSGGYSARSLCHNVLVPFVRSKRWSLKASGDEPLNNQPFFRIQESLKENVKVKKQENFQILIREMDKVQEASPEEARIGLAAFLAICREKAPRPKELTLFDLRLDSLTSILKEISDFVKHKSEGGRVGQALVAAALDAIYGSERVNTARVNDPSRSGLADVQVFVDESRIAAVYEVKQKNMGNPEESFHLRLSNEVQRAIFVDLSSKSEGASFYQLQDGRFALRIFGVNTFLWYAIIISPTPVEEWLVNFLRQFYRRLQELEVDSEVLEEFKKKLKLYVELRDGV